MCYAEGMKQIKKAVIAQLRKDINVLAREMAALMTQMKLWRGGDYGAQCPACFRLVTAQVTKLALQHLSGELQRKSAQRDQKRRELADLRRAP